MTLTLEEVGPGVTIDGPRPSVCPRARLCAGTSTHMAALFKSRLRLRQWLLSAGLVSVVGATVIRLCNLREPIGVDFHTYEAAAMVGLRHGWSYLYDQPLVTDAQVELVPDQLTQPFLSPPPVAWLAAPFSFLPYDFAFASWSLVATLALAAAVAWSSGGRQVERWVAAALVISPTWILVAALVGQVVPFVAVGIVIAWRLLREDRDVVAGLVLGLILLKPNTAFLVPVALLAAQRKRAIIGWSIAAFVGVALVLIAVGPQSLAQYVNELRHPPSGTDAVSLEAAFGVSGFSALALRLAVVFLVIGVAARIRSSPGLVLAVGVVGSLLVTPYLHLADLTLLPAAGLMVWQERPSLMWRSALAASWLFVSEFNSTRIGVTQNRWPLFELAWLIVLVGSAVRNDRLTVPTVSDWIRSALRATPPTIADGAKSLQNAGSLMVRSLLTNRKVLIALAMATAILAATAMYVQAAHSSSS